MPSEGHAEVMVDRKAGPGPFFMDKDKVGLTRRMFVREVNGALVKRGLPSEGISGHSFRIGAASAAAAGGASDEEIKVLGRWKSREYKHYIRRDGAEQAGAASKRMEIARTAGTEKEDSSLTS